MNNKECEAWRDGYDNGRESVLSDLLRESDKMHVINALFCKTSELENDCVDVFEKARMSAYSEGFRHCLNILKNQSNGALEAYHQIINATVKVELTQDDVKKYR